jgi:hypothetical protein
MLIHYPPAPALEPYIRRHYVFRGEMPADADIRDKMIAETAFIRIPLHGDWYIEGETGEWESARGPKLFGANSTGFPLRVVGPLSQAAGNPYSTARPISTRIVWHRLRICGAISQPI